jgi:hypothetical protein
VPGSSAAAGGIAASAMGALRSDIINIFLCAQAKRILHIS